MRRLGRASYRRPMARLVQVAMALGAIGALALVGCSGDDDAATSDRTASAGSKSGATTTTVEDLFDDPEPSDDPLDRSACDVVLEADMHAITRYPGTTASSVEQTKDVPPDPDDVVFSHRSECVYTVETTTALDDGGTLVSGGSGSVAYVTLSNDARVFSPDPSWPEYEAVKGVGDDAYWTDGGWTLMVKQGGYVVEFQVSIGLSLDLFPDVVDGRREMALALADLVLARL